jgi:hypothetical protein
MGITMTAALRVALYVIAAATCLLGLWGVLANLAIPLMPDYGKTQWNFFGPFEHWNPHVPLERERPLAYAGPPWWAISFRTPCPYLDPWLAGPVGYGFYALCLTWGLGTLILLRAHLRSITGRAFWPVSLFGVWWLSGLGGILALVWFFVSIARAAARAGLTP